MTLPNIFDLTVTQSLITRIENLHIHTKPKWGKMNIGQMLAHCCITYQYVYEPEKFKKPNVLMAWVLKTFVKKNIVNETPYKKNIRTAPDFIITNERNFEVEKEKLIQFLIRSQKDGETYFQGKESFSFGILTITEWSNMFYKHLDHHLTQFGV